MIKKINQRQDNQLSYGDKHHPKTEQPALAMNYFGKGLYDEKF